MALSSITKKQTVSIHGSYYGTRMLQWEWEVGCSSLKRTLYPEISHSWTPAWLIQWFPVISPEYCKQFDDFFSLYHLLHPIWAWEPHPQRILISCQASQWGTSALQLAASVGLSQLVGSRMYKPCFDVVTIAYSIRLSHHPCGMFSGPDLMMFYYMLFTLSSLPFACYMLKKLIHSKQKYSYYMRLSTQKKIGHVGRIYKAYIIF